MVNFLLFAAGNCDDDDDEEATNRRCTYAWGEVKWWKKKFTIHNKSEFITEKKKALDDLQTSEVEKKFESQLNGYYLSKKYLFYVARIE